MGGFLSTQLLVGGFFLSICKINHVRIFVRCCLLSRYGKGPTLHGDEQWTNSEHCLLTFLNIWNTKQNGVSHPNTATMYVKLDLTGYCRDTNMEFNECMTWYLTFTSSNEHDWLCWHSIVKYYGIIGIYGMQNFYQKGGCIINLICVVC